MWQATGLTINRTSNSRARVIMTSNDNKMHSEENTTTTNSIYEHVAESDRRNWR